MILSCSVFETRLVNYLEVLIQSLYHLFNIIWASVHELVRQEPPHFLPLLGIIEKILCDFTIARMIVILRVVPDEETRLR